MLDCLLFQGKYKDKIVIQGIEGHPDYEFSNWLKHLVIREHFIVTPFLNRIIPFSFAAADAIESASAGLIPEHKNTLFDFNTPLSIASFATFNAVSYLSLPDIRFTVSPLAFS